MRERPILFSAPMVRAILDGRKTQTRRVVKSTGLPCSTEQQWADRIRRQERCPYGQPGDRLWVKETWGYLGCGSTYPENTHRVYAAYHADNTRREIPFPSSEGMLASTPKQNLRYPPGYDDLDADEKKYVQGDLLTAWWKRKEKIVSIHMPRWASRITLEVTGVRVERLQECSEADAIAEGAEAMPWRVDDPEGFIDWPLKESGHPHRNGYALLWDSINGAGAWKANPWVWVVEFRRVP